MGTTFSILCFSADSLGAAKAAAAAFALVDSMNSIMSHYSPESELGLLNRSAGSGKAVAVSPVLWDVLQQSVRFAKTSRGAFDPTLGPLVHLWRQVSRMDRLPTASELAAAKAITGYGLLVFDTAARTVRLPLRGMKLDLGGIGKGYAAAEALKTIEALGFAHCLVDAGGDICLGNPPPGQKGWRVAAKGGDLLLANCAVATSGDFYRFVDIDGIRYSHIIHPETGYGLTGRTEVTVVAKSGAEADALASAVSVLGESAFDIYPGLAFRIAYPDGRETVSPAYQAHLATD